jgi:hypothetical protein
MNTQTIFVNMTQFAHKYSQGRNMRKNSLIQGQIGLRDGMKCKDYQITIHVKAINSKIMELSLNL